MRNDMFSMLRRSPHCLQQARKSGSRLGAVLACLLIFFMAVPDMAMAYSDEELRNVAERLDAKSSTQKIEVIEEMAADGDPVLRRSCVRCSKATFMSAKVTSMS